MCAVGFDAENNDAKNGIAETVVYVVDTGSKEQTLRWG